MCLWLLWIRMKRKCSCVLCHLVERHTKLWPFSQKFVICFRKIWVKNLFREIFYTCFTNVFLSGKIIVRQYNGWWIWYCLNYCTPCQYFILKKTYSHRWRAAIFRPMLGVFSIWPGRVSIVSHLLVHGASVFCEPPSLINNASRLKGK